MSYCNMFLAAQHIPHWTSDTNTL